MFERPNHAADAVDVTSKGVQRARHQVLSLHVGAVLTLLCGSLAGCEASQGDDTRVAQERSRGSQSFAPDRTNPEPSALRCDEPVDEPVELDGPTVPSEFRGSACVDAEIEGLVELPRLAEVKIDGDPSEWSNVTFEILGNAEREESMKLAVDCEHLYVLVQGTALSERTQLLLDTDGDAATGEPLALNDDWAASGADYLFANDWFVSHARAGFEWRERPGIAEARRGGNTVMEYRIPLKKLGGLIPPRFGLVFRNMRQLSSGGEELISQVPERGMWRVPPKYENRGMIVPAYFPPDEDAPWTALGQAARELAGAHDFWVAISGTDSGPHELTPQRMARWQALQESGAALFAYVGTCKHDKTAGDAGAPTVHGCDGLRRHCDVMADVLAWQAAVDDWNEQRAKRPSTDGAPREPLELAGIWIDEFYPKQEVTARGRVVEDRSGQVVPTNGYYHKLTTAMRRVNRSWKLIGNAGGRLESNQLNYGKLVDVVCSFEAKLAHTNPWQEDGDKGPGLQIQLVRPSYGQLALVHENPSERGMEMLVERVFSEGYSHVYSTEVPHSKPDKSLNQLWNIAPAYLVKQAQIVRARLDAGWKPGMVEASAR